MMAQLGQLVEALNTAYYLSRYCWQDFKQQLLAFGGGTAPGQHATEEYDGNTWTKFYSF
jgi:hypothetical protein